MKRLIIYPLLTAAMVIFISSCKVNSGKEGSTETVLDINPELFLEGTTVTTVDCTLSDGTKTTCYQIVATTPSDHAMGPWCPDNITDGAGAGGIWIDDGKVYDVDGKFIENLSTFYQDDTWRMYDAEGNVYKTMTLQDCINAANPNVGDEYKNYCVECIPEHIAGLERTWLIPITPVKLSSSTSFARGGGGPPPGSERGENGPPPGEREGGDRPPRGERPDAISSGPSVRGIAFNGTEFSASAPVNNILAAYTLAPFDDAGGHINVHQGYHYHAATGVSKRIEQEDGHAAMIGYAMDGHGIYSQLNENGKEPADLDDCRGHYDERRGYHYHVDAPGANNFINCLAGAYVNQAH
ncbi:MAG: YHYH protein [Cyclobacteriaceae bacterium]